MTLSGVFVASSTEPHLAKTRNVAQAKAGRGSQAMAREEITRTYCTSPVTSLARRTRPGSAAEPPPPQQQRPGTFVRRQQSAGGTSVQQQRTGIFVQRQQSAGGGSMGSKTNPTSARERRASVGCGRTGGGNAPRAEASKTFDAIDGALRAVDTALKADGRRRLRLTLPGCEGDLSPGAGEDVESLCGTECTESTACSSSLSEDGSSTTGQPLGPSLQDARRSLKERLRAEERSARFSRGLLAKLDELREQIASADPEAL